MLVTPVNDFNNLAIDLGKPEIIMSSEEYATRCDPMQSGLIAGKVNAKIDGKYHSYISLGEGRSFSAVSSFSEGVPAIAVIGNMNERIFSINGCVADTDISDSGIRNMHAAVVKAVYGYFHETPELDRETSLETVIKDAFTPNRLFDTIHGFNVGGMQDFEK